MIWFWLLFTAIFVALIGKFYQLSKLKKKLSNLPGPEIHNLLQGNLPILMSRKKEIGFHVGFAESLTGLTTIFREEGICRIWISINPYIFVYSAETIEPIISSHALIDKPNSYDLLHCWLGTGLLTSTGNKWKARRKLITPTFHYRILDQFIPIFDKNSRIFVKNLEEYSDKEDFDIIPLVTLCTLDIVCETAMGVEIKSQDKNRSDYINALYEFSSILMERFMKPWLYNDFTFYKTSDGRKLKKTLTILHGLTSKILKQRKEELKMEKESTKDIADVLDYEGKKKEPLLDKLIKYQFQNNFLTDKDICEEVDTFMFEGHDTTSMGISWALYHLGLYPNIQQKVYEELKRILGDDKEKPITAEVLREMKYLERVLKESQRISPSVPTVERYCSEDIKIKRYAIPRGCIFNIFIYALHRDPKVFPNPEIFDPDRFLPENCIGRHPYAYIPFSAGSRNCIGQKFAMNEMKIIVSRVVMNFVIKSLDPPDKISCSFLLVLRPTGGLRLKLKRRE